jgi:hypothetical protein
MRNAIRVLLDRKWLNWRWVGRRWAWRLGWRRRRHRVAHENVGRYAKGGSGCDISIRVAAETQVAVCVSVKQIVTFCRSECLDRLLVGDISESCLDLRAPLGICEFVRVDSSASFLTLAWRRRRRRHCRWGRRRGRVKRANAMPLEIVFATGGGAHVRIIKVNSIRGRDVRASGRCGGARNNIQCPPEV